MSNDCITYLESILEKLNTQMTYLQDIQITLNEMLLDDTPPTPPEPPAPAPGTMVVVVDTPLLKRQVPLQKVRGHNNAGYPTWRVYLDVQGKRVCPKDGKELVVFDELILGDGRNNAWQLAPWQVVDGHLIPADIPVFIFERHVER